MSAVTPLLTAIKARADGDTGSGGLFYASSPLITAWYSMLAPQEGSTIAYVVVFPISSVRNNSFDSTRFSDEIALQFSLFCDGSSDMTTDQTIVNAILTRFDRWAPTVSSYSASQLIHDGAQIVQEDNNIRHHVLDFRCLLGKA